MKILLNYLPFDKRESWPDVLLAQRTMYDSFVTDIMCHSTTSTSASTDHVNKTIFFTYTKPLNQDPSSTFYKFFDDVKILEQIDKDVQRTLPEFAFFQSFAHTQSTSSERTISNRAFFAMLQSVQSNTHSIPTPDEIDRVTPVLIMARPVDQQQHWEVIERILFVFSKLNPAVGYVQGMNEILCPIYFVLAHDGDEDSKSESLIQKKLKTS